MSLIVSNLSSGCWPSIYASWQLGGRETDCTGYRQRAGRGGGPGSDPKGTGPNPLFKLTVILEKCFCTVNYLRLHLTVKLFFKQHCQM